MVRSFAWFWYGVLKRPYRLACPIDVGEGTPVVLLHGLASSSLYWQQTVGYLAKLPLRVVSVDLLGFGLSPKPEWPSYDVATHAAAVIRTIERKRFEEPVILAGHSMGCLVAVHIAKLRPDLVKSLLLYEIPLYEGLPAKRRYNLRRDLYYALYRRIIAHPQYSPANARALQKIVARVMGFAVTRETWNSFVKSLKNTIMAQTTLEDMKQLNIPTEVIYGSLDLVVIRGRPRDFFGVPAAHISARTIPELHGISPRAATFLAGRIGIAAGLDEAQITAAIPKYRRYIKSPKTNIISVRKRKKRD